MSSSSSASWIDLAERQSISAALHTAERILGEVNEAIRDREGRERLEEISRSLWIGQARLDLTSPTRHLGPRRLLREGVLNKAKSGRKLRAVLCSDVLVLLDEGEKGLYRVVSGLLCFRLSPFSFHRPSATLPRRIEHADLLLLLCRPLLTFSCVSPTPFSFYSRFR